MKKLTQGEEVVTRSREISQWPTANSGSASPAEDQPILLQFSGDLCGREVGSADTRVAVLSYRGWVLMGWPKLVPFPPECAVRSGRHRAHQPHC